MVIDYTGNNYNMTYEGTIVRNSVLYVVWAEYSDSSVNSYINNQIWRYAVFENQQSANEVANFINNIKIYKDLKLNVTYDVPISGIGLSPMLVTPDSEGYKSNVSVPNPASFTRTNTTMFSPDTPTNAPNRPYLTIRTTATQEVFNFYSFPWLTTTCKFGNAYATRILASV
jgi:hypothetical protein